MSVIESPSYCDDCASRIVSAFVIGDSDYEAQTRGELVGRALVVVSGLGLFTVLNEREFEIISPFAVTGFFLLVVGLWAYYKSKRVWFSQLGKLSFWTMSGGTILTAISLPIAEYGPGIAFRRFLLGLFITMISAIAFEISMLRADVAPRAAAWLLILALSIGVPLTIVFTTYVMEVGADPWGGPMVFYGLGYCWYITSGLVNTIPNMLSIRAVLTALWNTLLSDH